MMLSLKSLFLIPVFGGWVYWFLVSICLFLFFRRSRQQSSQSSEAYTPFVSILKPVCGLEKNLKENLETACLQDYPNYEVIYAVQNPQDPALAVVQQIAQENPQKKIKIVVDETSIGPNGRICNLANALKQASGDVLVFSDSDMFLPNDYLRKAVSYLQNPQVGVVCHPYRAWKTHHFWEHLELLSLNAEFVPAMLFAVVTKSALACPGASQILKRETLEKIGGLQTFSHSLVEDFHLGENITKLGLQVAFVPQVIPTGVDLSGVKPWWRHQVYWDSNTRAANPVGFFFTLLIRAVPFSFLYFMVQGFWGFPILLITLALRGLTGFFNASQLQDAEGKKWLFLLPLRDLLGMATWIASFLRRKIYWKGRAFRIQKGRMIEIP